MRIGLGRVDPNRLPELMHRGFRFIPACQYDAEIQMRKTHIRIQLQCAPETVLSD